MLHGVVRYQTSAYGDGALLRLIQPRNLNEYRMMMRKEKPMESIEELEADGIYFHEEEIDGVMEVSVSKEIENLRNGCFLSMVRKLTLLQRMAFSLSDMFGCTIEETALLK